jgi:8-amino-7-oxononanoate synthase
MHEELKRVVKLCPRFYKYTAENPQSPIFSLECGDPKGLAIDLQRRGFVVRAIMSPTVPKGSERVRICVHAGNSLNDIVSLAVAIENYGQVSNGFPAGSSASKL